MSAKTNSGIQKIVLAYSGGLDTSVMLHWLKERHACPIVAYTADVGQGLEELGGLREKALRTGATDFVALDLKDQFVSDFVFPAVAAAAVYEGKYLLGTSLARPIIAAGHIQVAKQFGADAVAHGATGKGNDQVRFELTYYALQPDIKVVAPWRTWEFRSRSDLIAYAKANAIPVTATAEKPYSTDANVMHVSYEGGILEDPWTAPPKDIFTLTKDPSEAPDQPATLTVDFEAGIPVALDGLPLAPAALLEKLNALAGLHGVGRIDIVENRFVGIKSRGVYETPGVTVLHEAMRALESITLDREVLRLRNELAPKIATSIYNGFWYAPEFEALLRLVKDLTSSVTGTVKLQLFKGSCQVLGRKAPKSLYSPHLATFEADSVYQQADAEGFIKLQALRLKSYWAAQGGHHGTAGV